MIEYRKLSLYERELLQKMLSVEFQGVADLRRQLTGLLASRIIEYSDGDPSIQFKVKIEARAETKERVPVSARIIGTDGILIEFLLHVIDGKLNELEYVRYDGALVCPIPNIVDLEVVREHENK